MIAENKIAQVPLGSVAKFIRGINFKPTDVVPRGTQDTVACMRTKNVQLELDQSDVWFVANEFVKRDEQMLQKGDMLISSANSWNLVGKCCWIPDLPKPTTFGGFICALRAFSDELDSRYLYHWFSSPRIQTTVRSFGRQTTNISNLDIRRCEKLSLPLPSLSEQKRIAEILDRAEALRSGRRAALALLDELTQSVFLDMFGDPGFNGHEQATVAELIDKGRGGIRTGPFGSQLLHSEFTDDGVAVLGIDNAVQNEFGWNERRFISDAKYKKLKRYTVFPGDVIITLMGTCGRCAIVPDDIPLAINTKHLCCISLDRKKCLPRFLHAYFLRHPVAQRYLQDRAKGAIMSGLNMGIIKEMPVPLYPVVEQIEFARRIDKITTERQKLRGSLHQLDSLFASLQHRAFRGEL